MSSFGSNKFRSGVRKRKVTGSRKVTGAKKVKSKRKTSNPKTTSARRIGGPRIVTHSAEGNLESEEQKPKKRVPKKKKMVSYNSYKRRPKSLRSKSSVTKYKNKSSFLDAKKKTGIKSSRKKKKIRPVRQKRFTERRLDKHKFVNPFETKSKKYRTSFGEKYENDAIPARIFHQSSKMSIRWTTPISELPVGIILTFAEGLRETAHPYTVIAHQGFKELCESDDGRDRISPVLNSLIPLMRRALQVKKEELYLKNLEALRSLSDCVKGDLNDHLNSILVQVNKKMFLKKFAQKITSVLNSIEENSGEEVSKVIKKKCPTYHSVFM